MDKKNYINIITSILLIGFLYLFFYQISSYFHEVVLFEDFTSSWTKTLHTESNAYFLWRFKVSAILLSFLPGAVFVNKYIASLLIFFIIGNICIRKNFNRLLGVSRLVIESVLLSLIFLFLLGQDLIFLSIFSFVPLTAYILLIINKYEKLKYYLLCLLLVFFSVINFFIANQFSLISFLLSLVIYFIFSSYDSKKSFNILILAILSSLALACYLIPEALLPDYPHRAHVVADDGLPGFINPLIINDYPLPVIDKMGLKRIYSIPCLTIFFFCCFIMFVTKLKSSKLNYSILLISTLLLFDVFLSEQFVQILPVATLQRLIPGVQFFPLLLILVFFVLYLITFVNLRFIRVLSVGVFLLIVISSFYRISFDLQNTKLALLLTDKNRKVIDYYLDSVKNPKPQNLNSVLLSPSYSVVKEYGVKSIIKSKFLSFDDPVQMKAKYTASNRSKKSQMYRLRDRSYFTRWNTGESGQDGDEWLHIEFGKVRNLAGIKLSTGAFPSDFPRGVEVLVSAECKSPYYETRSLDSYKRVFYSNPWRGEALMTSNGYPYLGSQSNVAIRFNENYQVKCLLVRQLGKDSTFDWSIAEVFYFS